MSILVRFIQLIIIAIPLIVFGWLAQQFLVPTGEFFVHHSVEESSAFIDRLLPESRVDAPVQDNEGNWTQTINGDPAFFFVHPHRNFDVVEAEIWFQNDKLPIVELGGLAAKEPERYERKALQNLLIDTSDWNLIQRGDLLLLQRNKTFDSISDFLSSPPERKRIATYQVGLEQPFRIKGYSPNSTEQTIDVSLRGYHELKTYIKNETLHFGFELMDMNRDDGADPVRAIVFNENGLPVADVRLGDDGNDTGNAIHSDLRLLTLDVPGLPEGVYKVILDGSRDIFFRKIHSPQSKMVFLNQVFLGDQVAYRAEPTPIDFYSEAKRYVFQTRHAEGVQDISIGAKTFSVTEPFERYVFTSPALGLMKTYIPKRDVEVLLDGPMAFRRGHYFNPDPIRLQYYTDIDGLGVDYIFAAYTPAERRGDWWVKTVTFETSDLLFDNNTWKFAFSLPGIYEIPNSLLRVKEINLRFLRKSLSYDDVVSYFK